MRYIRPNKKNGALLISLCSLGVGHLLLPSAQLVFLPVCMALVDEAGAAGCARHLTLPPFLR